MPEWWEVRRAARSSSRRARERPTRPRTPPRDPWDEERERLEAEARRRQGAPVRSPRPSPRTPVRRQAAPPPDWYEEERQRMEEARQAEERERARAERDITPARRAARTTRARRQPARPAPPPPPQEPEDWWERPEYQAPAIEEPEVPVYTRPTRPQQEETPPTTPRPFRPSGPQIPETPPTTPRPETYRAWLPQVIGPPLGPPGRLAEGPATGRTRADVLRQMRETGPGGRTGFGAGAGGDLTLPPGMPSAFQGPGIQGPAGQPDTLSAWMPPQVKIPAARPRYGQQEETPPTTPREMAPYFQRAVQGQQMRTMGLPTPDLTNLPPATTDPSLAWLTESEPYKRFVGEREERRGTPVVEPGSEMEPMGSLGGEIERWRQLPQMLEPLTERTRGMQTTYEGLLTPGAAPTTPLSAYQPPTELERRRQEEMSPQGLDYGAMTRNVLRTTPTLAKGVESLRNVGGDVVGILQLTADLARAGIVPSDVPIVGGMALGETLGAGFQAGMDALEANGKITPEQMAAIYSGPGGLPNPAELFRYVASGITRYKGLYDQNLRQIQSFTRPREGATPQEIQAAEYARMAAQAGPGTAGEIYHAIAERDQQVAAMNSMAGAYLAQSQDPTLSDEEREQRGVYAAILGAQAAELKHMNVWQVYDKHRPIWSELLVDVVFDPLSLVGLASDILRISPIARRVATSNRLLAITPEVAAARLAAAEQTVANSVGTVYSKNIFTKIFGNTRAARAELDADNAYAQLSLLSRYATTKEDLAKITDAYVNQPELLLKGLSGMTGPQAQAIQAAGGRVRVAPAIVAGYEPKQLARVRRISAEIREQALTLPILQGTGPLAAEDTVEYLDQMNLLLTSGARRAAGVEDLNIPPGALRVEKRKVQGGFVVETYGPGDSIVERSGILTSSAADKQVQKYTSALRPRKGNYLTRFSNLMRGEMSSAYLNQRPKHWLNNALSAAGHSQTDGVLTLVPTRHIDDWIDNVVGVIPTRRMQEGAGSVAEFTQAPGGAYMARIPGLKQLDAFGRWVWTGDRYIPLGLMDIPVGEANYYKRAFYSVAKKNVDSRWERSIQDSLGPRLQQWGIPPQYRRQVMDTLIHAGRTGGKDGVVQALEELGTLPTMPFVPQSWGIPAHVLSLEGWRDIKSLIYGGQPRDEIVNAVNRIFDDETARVGGIINEVPPPLGTETFHAAEEAQVATDQLQVMENALKQAGLPPEQIQAQIAQFKAQVEGWMADVQQGVESLATAARTENPNAVGVVVDTWEEMYGANQAYRMNQGALYEQVDQAGRTPSSWMGYFQGNAANAAQRYQTIRNAISGGNEKLARVAAGEAVPTRSDAGWGFIERAFLYDEQAIGEARALQPGATTALGAKETFTAVIEANRAYVDHHVGGMWQAAQNYLGPETFDILMSVESQMDAVAAGVVAQITKARNAALAGDMPWDDFFPLRNSLWWQLADTHAVQAQAATKELVERAVIRELGDDLSWIEEFPGVQGQPVRMTLVGPTDEMQGTSRVWQVQDQFGIVRPLSEQSIRADAPQVMDAFYKYGQEVPAQTEARMRQIQSAVGAPPARPPAPPIIEPVVEALDIDLLATPVRHRRSVLSRAERQGAGRRRPTAARKFTPRRAITAPGQPPPAAGTRAAQPAEPLVAPLAQATETAEQAAPVRRPFVRQGAPPAAPTPPTPLKAGVAPPPQRSDIPRMGLKIPPGTRRPSGQGATARFVGSGTIPGDKDLLSLARELAAVEGETRPVTEKVLVDFINRNVFAPDEAPFARLADLNPTERQMVRAKLRDIIAARTKAQPPRPGAPTPPTPLKAGAEEPPAVPQPRRPTLEDMRVQVPQAARQGQMFEAGEDLPLMTGQGQRAPGGPAFRAQDVTRQESLLDLRPRMGEAEPSYAAKVDPETMLETLDKYRQERAGAVNAAEQMRQQWDVASAQREIPPLASWLKRIRKAKGGDVGAMRIQGKPIDQYAPLQDFADALLGKGSKGDDVLRWVQQYDDLQTKADKIDQALKEMVRAGGKRSAADLERHLTQGMAPNYNQLSEQEIISLRGQQIAAYLDVSHADVAAMSREELKGWAQQLDEIKGRTGKYPVAGEDVQLFSFPGNIAPHVRRMLGLDDTEDVSQLWRKITAGREAAQAEAPDMGRLAGSIVKDKDKARAIIIDNIDAIIKGNPKELSPQQLGFLQRWVADEGIPTFDQVLMASLDAGRKAADFTMLNYASRRGFDTAWSAFSPFPYWYSRSVVNWAERTLFKPSNLANWLRWQRAKEQYAKQKELPQRLEGKLPIPGTDLFIQDPTDLWFPWASILPKFNWNEISEDDGLLDQVLKTGDMFGFGLFPVFDWLLQLGKQKAYEAGAGETPLGEFLGLDQPGDLSIRPLLPPQVTLLIQGLMAAGVEMPLWMRTAMDGWDPYRGGRKASELVQNGTIPQDLGDWVLHAIDVIMNGAAALPEMPAEAMKWAKTALQLAAQDRLLTMATNFFGLGVQRYTEEEAQLKEAAQQYREYKYDPVTNPFGSRQAAQTIPDKTPGLGTYWGKNALVPGAVNETSPGVEAATADYFKAKKERQAEQDAAIEEIFAEQPGITWAAALLLLIALGLSSEQIDAEMAERFPSAQPSEEFKIIKAGMNPQEQAVASYQALARSQAYSDKAKAREPEFPAKDADLPTRVQFYKDHAAWEENHADWFNYTAELLFGSAGETRPVTDPAGRLRQVKYDNQTPSQAAASRLKDRYNDDWVSYIAEVEQKFPASVWAVAEGYDAEWSSEQKSTYIKKNPWLPDYWDYRAEKQPVWPFDTETLQTVDQEKVREERVAKGEEIKASQYSDGFWEEYHACGKDDWDCKLGVLASYPDDKERYAKQYGAWWSDEDSGASGGARGGAESSKGGKGAGGVPFPEGFWDDYQECGEDDWACKRRVVGKYGQAAEDAWIAEYGEGSDWWNKGTGGQARGGRGGTGAAGAGGGRSRSRQQDYTKYGYRSDGSQYTEDDYTELDRLQDEYPYDGTTEEKVTFLRANPILADYWKNKYGDAWWEEWEPSTASSYSYGGGGGGGWSGGGGGGGGGGFPQFPNIDMPYAVPFTRELADTGNIPRYEAPRISLDWLYAGRDLRPERLERWRPPQR